MADLGQTFDPASVPPDDRDFDVLPSGNYEAQVIESSVAATKAGDGTILKLTWEIISGQFERRKVWQNLNIENPSAEAQGIGQRQLAQVCEATGAGAVRDSEELHFKPCLIVVGIEKDKTGQYQDKNKVNRVKPLGGAAPPARPAARAAPPAQPAQRQAPPQQARQPARAAPANGGATRPWTNKAVARAPAELDDEIPF